jgi:hypothetical protein
VAGLRAQRAGIGASRALALRNLRDRCEAARLGQCSGMTPEDLSPDEQGRCVLCDRPVSVSEGLEPSIVPAQRLREGS